jgi:hypothetical protein
MASNKPAGGEKMVLMKLRLGEAQVLLIANQT